MSVLTEDYPELFLNSSKTPCISLYQPTHPAHPDREQDVIRFKNLVKKIESSLEKNYSSRETTHLMKPFYDLMNNHTFWTHVQNGLAILANEDLFKLYKLPREVPELAVVADNFHIKPLIRIMQSAGHFQVLALTRRQVKLYEGTRDALEEVTLHKEVPKTLTEALGHEVTEPRLTVSAYGKGTEGPPMHHGHGGRKDEIDVDAERYFRRVDEAITKHHSQTSKLPLLLAALPEYHHMFHEISQNPYLLPDDIRANPEELTVDEIRKRAWKVIEPYYLAKLNALVERFGDLSSNNKGSDELEDVARAAVSGRIETLLIDADRRIPGQIDHETGEYKLDEMLNPEVDDLLDDLGELVLKSQGDVIVVPSDKMPTDSGLAAIYRY
ncbi:baeRF3 domain-containing protein [Legionella impletisoli]|uniref:Uncharacterized protein n=1 Tax=Legionella impletisoli TaxID=343510 RepID=A0A917NDH9_9GAMM|nr:hypothetical protein [Legionella impletisoli]GGI90098.1 hypothetical protein GCM10007966_18550 [Legionella impletisoli]